MMTYDRILGFDPNGTCRVYVIEARQEARNYIRQQADTAPLAACRFEFLVLPERGLQGRCARSRSPPQPKTASQTRRPGPARLCGRGQEVMPEGSEFTRECSH